jgi:hypothetical protein
MYLETPIMIALICLQTKYPQVYGTIIIEFHLGVFQGIVIYIFPKEGKVYASSIGINMITYF